MVIDASVWIAAFLPEDVHHAPATALLRQLAQERRRVVLPTLAQVEIAGAIARRSDSAETATAVLHFLLAQGWIEHAALDSHQARAAAALAAGCRLRGPDAVYVALAASRGLPLIALDLEMLERAPAEVERMTPADWLQRASG